MIKLKTFSLEEFKKDLSLYKKDPTLGLSAKAYQAFNYYFDIDNIETILNVTPDIKEVDIIDMNMYFKDENNHILDMLKADKAVKYELLPSLFNTYEEVAPFSF